MKANKVPFESLQIEDKIILRYSKGNPNNRTYHVRGFVDGRIVLSMWSRRWKAYRYVVETSQWYYTFVGQLHIQRPNKLTRTHKDVNTSNYP